MEKEQLEKKREKRDEREQRYIQSIRYFWLGILLSLCIVAGGIFYALPKMEKTGIKAEVPTVTAELVADTVKSSMGEYLASNKIVISDDGLEEVVQYVADSVNGQTQLTENELLEVKNLIKISVQNVNDSMNNSMVTLQEFVINGKSEVSGTLKEYIDKYVVPGIVASVKMNSQDIVTVNEIIVEMGNDYNTYKEVNDTNLAEIMEMIENYKIETGMKIAENREELIEKLNDFCTEYDSYVKRTDSEIDSVKNALGKYVTVIDFKEFESSYKLYKEDAADIVAEIKENLSRLEEDKADKSTVRKLSENLGELKGSYDSFTGESGEFENLKNRVMNTEFEINQNNDSLAALEKRVNQLENGLSKIYLVGSVYMTFGEENPAELYGGSWEKVEDTFLMCAGSSYPAGTEGGKNEVTLQAENIPSLNIKGKTVSFLGSTENSGEHTHTTNDGTVFMTASGGDPVYEIAPSLVGDAPKWLWPSKFYNHCASVSVSGNHNHNFTIPELALTGSYTNNNLQGIDITNKYVAVNVWKRVA